MADHNLDREPGLPRIADDINTLKNQISELRTLQLQGNAALNLQVSTTASATASVPTGTSVTFTMTLTNAGGASLFGIPQMTLFEGSVASGTQIGYGLARDVNYDFAFVTDWNGTNNTYLVAKASLKNNTGSTQTIVFQGNWKFLVASASVS